MTFRRIQLAAVAVVLFTPLSPRVWLNLQIAWLSEVARR